ncbi:MULTISPECIES: hypothetical protein [Prauserella salsuginis group]|uniref:Uncharacterized protein n=1 Tax=Prauserella salsuginis TaxID=387889 RepID=A0ABW6G0W2_9PSEU|nr:MULTISPECIES: hypothetical protein [Prauserella salsuginis group]
MPRAVLLTTNALVVARGDTTNDTRYRFSSIAASRELNVMVLGGTTPFIATMLVEIANGSP